MNKEGDLPLGLRIARKTLGVSTAFALMVVLFGPLPSAPRSEVPSEEVDSFQPPSYHPSEWQDESAHEVLSPETLERLLPEPVLFTDGSFYPH